MATNKYLYREPEKDRVRLQPAYPYRPPLYVQPDKLRVQGKVVGVIRKI